MLDDKTKLRLKVLTHQQDWGAFNEYLTDQKEMAIKEACAATGDNAFKALGRLKLIEELLSLKEKYKNG